MKKLETTVAATTALLAAAAGAHAAWGTLTADNHYSFYTGSPDGVSMIGHNELGTAGAPGTYNWSSAETWEFEAGDWLYVAAWSDDAVAQGFLGHFDIDDQRILTGDAVWEVFATGIDLDDGDAAPTSTLIQQQVTLADASDLWDAPMVYEANGGGPWSHVSEVDDDARWMWATPPDPDTNTLIGGADWDEFLIFRTRVPSPGVFSIAATALLFTTRRRRPTL